jgi:cytochrome c553
MRRKFSITAAGLALVLVSSTVARSQGPPAWAYGTGSVPAPAAAPPSAPSSEPPDTTLKSVPGSSLQFTRAQISNPLGPADWFPGDHPPMPEVVAHHGQNPIARACALCHYPNGKGRSENAGVAGLPESYFLGQLRDFRNGNRRSAEPRKANTNTMIAIAKAMTDEEMQQAADYFSSMKWSPWIKVVETDMAPQTRLTPSGLFLSLDNGEKQPLGQRILEVPENTEAAEVLRDPHSGFIAYVPVGSIKKGEALVSGGGGKTTPCRVCHGQDLSGLGAVPGVAGLGAVPGIAGRSPSYLVRQLYDIQKGTRNGTGTAAMKAPVAKLTEEDILNIAAYLASLNVQADP